MSRLAPELAGVLGQLSVFRIGGQDQPGCPSPNVHRPLSLRLLSELDFRLALVEEMTCAVEDVGIGPVLHGFFAVGPDEPDAVAVAGFAAELIDRIGSFVM